ncbi:copper resistance CopC family protein [Micromonospora sp. NPDC004551]|uniref:copper resistance CopC family protein n=1 Tax=Micromonospora sp. NPDC004551 TaxID=3154284 RepID=UPI0033AF6F8C
MTPATPVTDRAPSPARARVLAAVVLTVVVGIALLLATSREPDLRLVGAEPGGDAPLRAAPTSVSLTFSEDLSAATAHLTVAGPDGRPVNRGAPTVDGHRLTVATVDGGQGRYRLAYHLSLTDGSEVSGSDDFVVGTAAPAPAPAPEDSGGHQHLRRDGWNLALALADLVLVLGALVALLPARRRPARDGGRTAGR